MRKLVNVMSYLSPNCHGYKLVFYTPTQVGGSGGLQSFWIIKFQRNGSKVLEKDILGCKIGKRLKEDLHLKGTEKKITTANFSKYVL